MKYFITALKNYGKLSGRARRKEYWYFILFNLIISFGISLFENILYFSGHGGNIRSNIPLAAPIGYFSLIYFLFIITPSFTVSVRRLHDTGRSAWFLLLIFIPAVGFMVLLILMCIDSTYGLNKYGLNPKGIGNPDEIDSIGEYL